MDRRSLDDPRLPEDRSSARARRGRMQVQALARRALAPQTDRFATPDWLDRSFVLPLTAPDLTAASPPAAPNVPSQGRPRHDDLAPRTVRDNAPAFRRPDTPDIDFALVVRRTDLTRTCSRVARTAGGFAGLSLVAFLLVAAPWLLVCSAALLVVALGARAAQVHLTHLPLPYLAR